MTKPNKPQASGTKFIPLSRVKDPDNADRFNLQEAEVSDLANSIAQHGMLQAITVLKVGDDYEVVAGHRRVMAMRSLGKETIEAKVLDTDDNKKYALRLTENVQRKDLSPLEQAVALVRMREKEGITQEQAAEKLGKGVEWVKKREILCELPEELLEAVQQQTVSPSVAIELRRIENDEVRKYYVAQAIQHGCSQATASAWVANYIKDQPNEDTPTSELQVQPDFGGKKVQGNYCHLTGLFYPYAELQTVFIHSSLVDQSRGILAENKGEAK